MNQVLYCVLDGMHDLADKPFVLTALYFAHVALQQVGTAVGELLEDDPVFSEHVRLRRQPRD